MLTPFHKLEAEVLLLGLTDRAHFLVRLIDSFEPDSAVPHDWIAEALRRDDEVLAGNVALVPGQEAIAGIRAKFS